MDEYPRDKTVLDEELVKRAQDGDNIAVNILVDRHHAVVFSKCLAIIGDEDLAADASQESFIKAFRSLDRFRGDSSFKTWLLAITINESRGFLRKIGRLKEQVLEGVREIVDPGNDPMTEVVIHSEADRIREAMSGLPKKQRLSVMLRIEDGLSFKEISKIIGSSDVSARVNYHNGIHKLRELLEP